MNINCIFNFFYSGGEITVPVPSSADNIRKKVRDMLNEGKLKLGELLEPKQYKRFILRKGEIVEEIFTVNGRKYPLLQISENSLKDHALQGLMRENLEDHINRMTKPELLRSLWKIHEYCDPTMTKENLREALHYHRTRRHLLVWQDHSTLANHGHLLLMIRVMYDPALYHTLEELKEMTGKDIDVQEIVERPEVYLLARAQDTIMDKLSYVETRMEDVQELTTKLKLHVESETEITDVMRFFAGDHPDQNSEKGQQEGGHYPCAGCNAKATNFMDIEYCYRQ